MSLGEGQDGRKISVLWEEGRKKGEESEETEGDFWGKKGGLGDLWGLGSWVLTGGIGNRVQQDLERSLCVGTPSPDIPVLSLFPPALLPAPASPVAADPAARLPGGFAHGFREGRAGDPTAPLAGASG